MDTANHWNSVYRSSPVQSLGWYEQYASPSLDLISRCGLVPDDLIIDVGSGATSLIGSLIYAGHRNLIALDISSAALDSLRKSLTGDREQYVRFILDDIRSPGWVTEVGEVALWHDRALLHFLIDDPDRLAYVDRVRALLKPGGFLVIGAFSLLGASRCSGLPVRRYSLEMLSELLGGEFRLEESLDYLYKMPTGDTRPYIYARFRRLPRVHP
jgi:SAM-dependent methyltransferase